MPPEPRDTPPPDTGISKPPVGGGLPDVSTFVPFQSAPGSVFSGPGGLTFYYDGFGLKPLSTSSTSDKYINLGGGYLFDTTTGQTVNAGLPSGAGGTGVSTINAQIAANTADKQLAQDWQKFVETEGYNKAVNDQQYGLKAADLTGVFNGQPTLAAQAQRFNQFKTLSDIASNPRNFMQTFFTHRGFTPPPDVAGYGNGPTGLGSPYFDASAFSPRGATTAPPKPTQPAALNLPQSRVGAPAYQAPGMGAAPNIPSDAKLGYGANNVPVSLSDWAVKNLAKPDTTAYGGGGVTPEPILGVGAQSNPALFHSLTQSPGHKYLIGEKGPEGVVPAEFMPDFLKSRKGKAAFGDGGPLGMPSRMMQGASPLAGRTMDGGAAKMAGDITAFADGGYLGSDNQMYATPTTADTAMQNGYKIWAGGPYSGQRVDQTPANAGDLTPYLNNPNTPDPTGQVQQSFPAGSTGLAAPQSSQPSYSLGSGQTFNESVQQGGQTNPVTDPFMTDPLGALRAAGAVPPWLARLIGQGQGAQSVGTNVPQKAILPNGVPLASNLGFNQLEPSEQQALLSFVSSYGIDPNDYLAQIASQVSAARRRQNIDYVGQ